MGARLRLKASRDISGFTPEMQRDLPRDEDATA